MLVFPKNGKKVGKNPVFLPDVLKKSKAPLNVIYQHAWFESCIKEVESAFECHLLTCMIRVRARGCIFRLPLTLVTHLIRFSLISLSVKSQLTEI